MWLLKLVFVLAAIYLTVVTAIYAGQTWLLFPTWLVPDARDVLPPSAVTLTVDTPDGARLTGHYIPAGKGPVRPLVLGFGGNAWNAADLAAYLHARLPGAPVAAFHYRGYGPSTGRPSAEALLADALTVHDHLARTLVPERIVAVGLSIGAGPAAQLARHRPISGLILVSPFDSLEILAREHYPWAPVHWLLRHRMDILDLVRGLAMPAALIAAARDTIVPPHRTAPLRAAMPNLVLDRTIPDAGHNDLYGRAEFAAAFGEALERIETAVTAPSAPHPIPRPPAADPSDRRR